MTLSDLYRHSPVISHFKFAFFVNMQHTHTHLTALFPGLPRWAGTRKVKPICILLKQESEWQWHQLGHMQVCTSLQTDNHASTPPLSFLQAGCPSCRPTNGVKALKACKYAAVEKISTHPMLCFLTAISEFVVKFWWCTVIGAHFKNKSW